MQRTLKSMYLKYKVQFMTSLYRLSFGRLKKWMVVEVIIGIRLILNTYLLTYLAQYSIWQEVCFQKNIEAKELLSLSGSFCPF